MLCTECSKEVLPIVVFDIDGTLAEYHRHLADFCWDYWAMQSHGLPRRGERPWDGEGDFEDYLHITQDQYREAKLAFRQGGGKRTMPPIADGMYLYRHVRGVDEEASMGMDRGGVTYRPDFLHVEMWIATHRPYRRLDNVDPDTRFWLDRYGITFDHLLFSDDKYTDLVDQVDANRIIAVFEDLPEYVDQALDLKLPVAQVARPHNSGPTQIRPQRGTLEQLQYWYDEQARNWTERQETA